MANSCLPALGFGFFGGGGEFPHPLKAMVRLSSAKLPDNFFIFWSGFGETNRGAKPHPPPLRPTKSATHDRQPHASWRECWLACSCVSLLGRFRGQRDEQQLKLLIWRKRVYAISADEGRIHKTRRFWRLGSTASNSHKKKRVSTPVGVLTRSFG